MCSQQRVNNRPQHENCRPRQPRECFDFCRVSSPLRGRFLAFGLSSTSHLNFSLLCCSTSSSRRRDSDGSPSVAQRFLSSFAALDFAEQRSTLLALPRSPSTFPLAQSPTLSALPTWLAQHGQRHCQPVSPPLEAVAPSPLCKLDSFLCRRRALSINFHHRTNMSHLSRLSVVDISVASILYSLDPVLSLIHINFSVINNPSSI